MSRLEQSAIAFDQLINAVVFNGMADETLSARLYRHSEEAKWKWLYRTVNVIFFLQKDHCREAYMSEISRKHLPKEYRRNAI